jgi:hypothetical protein
MKRQPCPGPSRAWNARALYSVALIGVHDHSGHLAAAHGDGHGQRAVSRGRVMVP